MSENPENLLTRINLGAQSYSSGGGGTAATRNDILASIGMAHFKRPVWLAIQVYYFQDETQLRPLAKALWMAAVDLAIEHQWKAPTGSELLRKMAVLAIYELLQRPLCGNCKNDDKDRLKCERCGGRGYRDLSYRSQAKRCGVTPEWWRKQWRPRYRLVQQALSSWLAEVDIYLSSEAGSFRDCTSPPAGSSGSPSSPWGFDPKKDQCLRQEMRNKRLIEKTA